MLEVAQAAESADLPFFLCDTTASVLQRWLEVATTVPSQYHFFRSRPFAAMAADASSSAVFFDLFPCVVGSDLLTQCRGTEHEIARKLRDISHKPTNRLRPSCGVRRTIIAQSVMLGI
jgi:hypothetical protein